MLFGSCQGERVSVKLLTVSNILASLRERMLSYDDKSTRVADIIKHQVASPDNVCPRHSSYKQLPSLSREYSRYVSLQQMGRGVLDRKMTKAQFQAFIMVCIQSACRWLIDQSRESLPRCRRRVLADLLVNPVQHMPRYRLLFKGDATTSSSIY
jgi:hypothetical protein